MKILGHTYTPKKGTVVDGLPAVIVLESGTTTKFITDSQIGEPDYPWLTIVSMPTKEFETKFARTQDDLQAIAKIYREHAQQLGATPEALDALGYIVTIDKGTVNMSTANATEEKKSAAAKAPAKTSAKTPPTKATAPAPKAPAKAPAPAQKETKPPKVAAAPKEPKEKRPSVSSRICELIMAGKLSDDEIFATVKKEFNLDDSKRGYVGWNRNHLRKQGQNPPGPIGMEKKTAAEKPVSKSSPPTKATVNRKTGAGKA